MYVVSRCTVVLVPGAGKLIGFVVFYCVNFGETPQVSRKTVKRATVLIVLNSRIDASKKRSLLVIPFSFHFFLFFTFFHTVHGMVANEATQASGVQSGIGSRGI